MKFFEKQIGSNYYKAGALPARKALSLKIKLANALGPGLSGLKIPGAGSSSQNIGGLSPEGASAIAAVATAFGAFLESVDEARFFSIVDLMLENVEVRVGDGYVKALSVFDSLFMASLDELYKVLAEVFVLNFPFLANGLAEKVKGIISKLPTTTPKAPNGSQTVSGETSPTN